MFDTHSRSSSATAWRSGIEFPCRFFSSAAFNRTCGKSLSRSSCPTVGDSVTIRSEPSRPIVSFAVRDLPLIFQQTKRCPPRIKTSAPAGIGRVTVFLKMAPSVLPLENLTDDVVPVTSSPNAF